MPHDDKHYQKLQRTFKFVFDALWLVAVVLIVGLLLIWIYDKIGGTFLPRPWKIVFLIIFAILAALTRVPEYIHDLRKIDLGELVPSQEVPKERPYAAQLAHAHEEGLIDEDNRLQVPRSDFVRFCVKNDYFRPHRKENWKAIDKVLKDQRTGEPVTAAQLAQTFQDLQARGGV